MKLSKKYLVHAAAVFLCTVATLVAGPQPLEKNVAPAPPPAEIDWAGPYVGLNAGVNWTHYDFSRYSTDVDLEEQFYEAVPPASGEFTSIATFPVTNHSESHPDVIGGGQLGYNFQFGHFVAGMEGGFSAAPSDAWKRSEQFQINPINFIGTVQLGEIVAETSFNSRRHAETNWNGYVGGQLGYAWWRLLFYGNVGAAFTDLQVTARDRVHTDFFEEGCVGTCPGAPSQPVDSGGLFIGGVTNTTHRSHDDVLTGFYGGGGIQYALNEMIRVGVEYRHCDFGDQTFSFHSAGPVFSGRTNFDLHSDQLTFRVNIMLGRLWPFHH